MGTTLVLEAFGHLKPETAAIVVEEEDLHSVFRARSDLVGWSTLSGVPHPQRWNMHEAELADGDDSERVGWAQVGVSRGSRGGSAGVVPVSRGCAPSLWGSHVVGLAGDNHGLGTAHPYGAGTLRHAQLVPLGLPGKSHGALGLGPSAAGGLHCGWTDRLPSAVEHRCVHVWPGRSRTETTPDPSVAPIGSRPRRVGSDGQAAGVDGERGGMGQGQRP